MSEIEPITREELLLNSIAGEGDSGLSPITRQEHYLSAIAGESDLPADMEPITREEIYYQKILDNGGAGGGGGEATGTKNITTNGDHDVTAFATAHVDVPTGITPSGSQEFTQNGTYDVTSLAEAVVNVAGSEIGGDTFYEEIYLEFDNINKNRSITLPVSDTSFDNYLVQFNICESGVYEDDSLVLDEVPTLRAGMTGNFGNFIIAGTHMMLSNRLTVAGKLINTADTEVSKTYTIFRGTYITVNTTNGGFGGAAVDNPITVSGDNLLFNVGVNNNARLCYSGYYFKYKFIVQGWNDPVTEATA